MTVTAPDRGYNFCAPVHVSIFGQVPIASPTSTYARVVVSYYDSNVSAIKEFSAASTFSQSNRAEFNLLHNPSNPPPRCIYVGFIPPPDGEEPGPDNFIPCVVRVYAPTRFIATVTIIHTS